MGKLCYKAYILNKLTILYKNVNMMVKMKGKIMNETAFEGAVSFFPIENKYLLTHHISCFQINIWKKAFTID
jgi:hypothetical protein